eukprot:SRR837773.9577.p3 GENE.SRR837773.9577~~SRR837773.9577.p3  ORF type:complete len:114 (+),score=21.15 SRR837773.9577:149-490(+)
MWACAFALDANYAGLCGLLWSAGRVGYGYVYRVTSSRNKLMMCTIPCYIGQLMACGGILAAVIPLPRVQAMAAAAGVCVAFVGYGWFGYRPWFQAFVEREKTAMEAESGGLMR